MKMPTHERRYFLISLINEGIDAEENDSNKTTVQKTGKFTQTRTFSPK